MTHTLPRYVSKNKTKNNNRKQRQQNNTRAQRKNSREQLFWIHGSGKSREIKR